MMAAAILAQQLLQAQQLPVAGDSVSLLLDPVTVTATRYLKKQSQTGKVVTVISRQDIEKQSGRNIAEILNTQAGVNILGNQNSPGTNLSTAIRGSATGNVLILIDGVPIYDPSANTNYFDLNFIVPEQVERIEVLKGGQSTLYGTDAVAGVINIILKKRSTGGKHVDALFSLGSYNTHQQNVALSGAGKSVNYSVGYTHMRSAGFSAAEDKNNTGNFDDDGIKQQSLNLRADIQLNSKLSWQLSSLLGKYKADADAGAFTDERDYTIKNRNAVLSTGLLHRMENGVIKMNYTFNYVDRFYDDDSLFKSSMYVDWWKSTYTGRSHFTELFANHKMDNFELSGGVEFRKNNIYNHYISQSPASPPFTTVPSIYETLLKGKTMGQQSIFASVIIKPVEIFNVELGGRFNNHSEYGTNFTYTINPFIKLQKGVKLFLNAYSAYKIPTLYQLFDASAGNAALEPEKSNVFEGGIDIQQRIFRIRAVGFYRSAKDVIIYSYNPATFASKYINVSRQYNSGTELEATLQLQKVTITTNYTYTDGKTESRYDGTGIDLGKDTSYFNLYRIPRHAFNANFGYQISKKVYTSLQLHAVSERSEYIYGAPPETLKGYTLLNLNAQWQIIKQLKWFIDFKNITNKKYTDFLGYNTRRFNFTTGVRLSL